VSHARSRYNAAIVHLNKNFLGLDERFPSQALNDERKTPLVGRDVYFQRDVKFGASRANYTNIVASITDANRKERFV